jgi:hypothetical protein
MTAIRHRVEMRPHKHRRQGFLSCTPTTHIPRAIHYNFQAGGLHRVLKVVSGPEIRLTESEPGDASVIQPPEFGYIKKVSFNPVHPYLHFTCL